MAFSTSKASSSPSVPPVLSVQDHGHSQAHSTDSSSASFAIIDRERGTSVSDIMDNPDESENITGVMAQVLSRMNRVVEHFRENGENDAANSMAKHIMAMINIFSETIATWDTSLTAMRAPPPLSSARMRVDSPTARSDPHVGAEPASGPATTSWAAVAATAPAADNKIVKFTPIDGVRTRSRGGSSLPLELDTDSEKRVVWIRGWSADKSMSEITDNIGQGPIYSMAYSEKDAAVCVIFQYADSAKALSMDDQLFMKNHGHSRFGPGCDVAQGLAFPDNDDLRRMSSPFNERRRLTFARSQLFQNGMNEERFKRDIYSIVGQKNVELVWLFNTGNATAVFSAVPLARLVRNEFIKTARNHLSPYHGVSITFSHDPCERPMTLITQILSSRQPRPVVMYGRNGLVTSESMIKGGPSSRRNGDSEVDGWQTVGKRR